MTTGDGIGTADWDVVHGLTLSIVNATSVEDRATARSRLFAFLDELESRYGTLPSILATRADFIDDAALKTQLLQDAYSLAVVRADYTNLAYVSHSLAEFYVEECRDARRAREWLAKFKTHLLETADLDLSEEYLRLCQELKLSSPTDKSRDRTDER